MEEFKRGLSNEFINVYYRGRNICRVDGRNKKYIYSFDENYIENNKKEFQTLFEKGNIRLASTKYT